MRTPDTISICRWTEKIPEATWLARQRHQFSLSPLVSWIAWLLKITNCNQLPTLECLFEYRICCHLDCIRCDSLFCWSSKKKGQICFTFFEGNELLTTCFHKKNEERIPKLEEIWNNLFIFRESMSWIDHKFQIVVKFIYSEKVSKFCKVYVLCSDGQIYSGDFAKFSGLLRIYEHYKT